MKKLSEWIERLFETYNDPLPKSADVIIGIGIDVSANGCRPSPQSAQIALDAAELFESNEIAGVECIIFTGGYGIRKGLTEAFLMSKHIIKCRGNNSPATHVVTTENESTRTWFNADKTLERMKKNGWRSAVILAQQTHARRVRATFWKRWNNYRWYPWRKRCRGEYRIAVIKARSEYTGGNSQNRLKRFWKFFLWDTAAFVISYLKGYC